MVMLQFQSSKKLHLERKLEMYSKAKENLKFSRQPFLKQNLELFSQEKINVIYARDFVKYFSRQIGILYQIPCYSP